MGLAGPHKDGYHTYGGPAVLYAKVTGANPEDGANHGTVYNVQPFPASGNCIISCLCGQAMRRGLPWPII